MITKFKVDGVDFSVDVEGETPLLWVLRDHLNLTNTKFGCGIGQCGACTVLMGKDAIRACSTPVSMAANQSITTIANEEDQELKKLQNAWVQEDVAQCGYCQPGQIMNALSLVKQTPRPTDEQIVFHMDGNICRCGTYNKINAAIKSATTGV